MDDDINRRIAAEQAWLAQQKRAYDQAHAKCVAQLSSLCSELTSIQQRVQGAREELFEPSFSNGRTSIDRHYELSDWRYWDCYADYHWCSPTLKTYFLTVHYNPLTDEYKFNHCIYTRSEVVERFKRALTHWAVDDYPRVKAERDREKADYAVKRRQSDAQERSRRNGNIIAFIIVFLAFALFYHVTH